MHIAGCVHRHDQRQVCLIPAVMNLLSSVATASFIGSTGSQLYEKGQFTCVTYPHLLLRRYQKGPK